MGGRQGGGRKERRRVQGGGGGVGWQGRPLLRRAGGMGVFRAFKIKLLDDSVER